MDNRVVVVAVLTSWEFNPLFMRTVNQTVYNFNVSKKWFLLQEREKSVKKKIVKSEIFKNNVNGKYDVFIEDFSLKTERYQFRMVNTETGEERIDGVYKTPHYNEVYEEIIEDLLTF